MASVRQLRNQINITAEQVALHKDILKKDLHDFSSWAALQLRKPELIVLILLGFYLTRKKLQNNLPSIFFALSQAKHLFDYL
jgi:hypothetical protein